MICVINFFRRVFRLLKEIIGGTIFAFLVTCAPFVGISFYNFEQVKYVLLAAKKTTFFLFRLVYCICFVFKTATELSLEDAIAIIFSLLTIFCSLAWPFLLCLFATFATERIKSIDLTVYNGDWLNYPPHLHKHIVLIIAQSRTNIGFNGFQIFDCDLETFAKVRDGLPFL